MERNKRGSKFEVPLQGAREWERMSFLKKGLRRGLSPEGGKEERGIDFSA